MTWLPFDRSHFSTYKSWFEDQVIDQWLGPIDEEWLEYILHEDDGQQYAICTGDKLIAVIGLKHLQDVQDKVIITDLSVSPDQRGRGIGSSVLSELKSIYSDIPHSYWATYVSTDNHLAISFFEKNDWVQIVENDEDDNMIKFKPKSSKI